MSTIVLLALAFAGYWIATHGDLERDQFGALHFSASGREAALSKLSGLSTLVSTVMIPGAATFELAAGSVAAEPGEPALTGLAAVQIAEANGGVALVSTEVGPGSLLVIAPTSADASQIALTHKNLAILSFV